jgi:hypothetical protein
MLNHIPIKSKIVLNLIQEVVKSNLSIIKGKYKLIEDSFTKYWVFKLLSELEGNSENFIINKRLQN